MSHFKRTYKYGKENYWLTDGAQQQPVCTKHRALQTVAAAASAASCAARRSQVFHKSKIIMPTVCYFVHLVYSSSYSASKSKLLNQWRFFAPVCWQFMIL